MHVISLHGGRADTSMDGALQGAPLLLFSTGRHEVSQEGSNVSGLAEKWSCLRVSQLGNTGCFCPQGRPFPVITSHGGSPAQNL